ncbi:MAG: 50S ribosomal protein L14e [Candidatus Micrarchaeota archaeon]
MPAIEKGRICYKKTGRDAGKKCVIISVSKGNFVEIVAQGRKKKRKCNISHLEALGKTISVDGKSEADILNELV